MIKVIKKGTKKEQECEKCGCVFSYDDGDVTEIRGYSSEIVLLSRYKKYIKCPQCNHMIILEASK